jgi:site-specific DNA-cytosine methylase
MREGKEGGGKGPLVSNDQSLTLATGNDQVLAYRWQNDADGIVPDEVASTLRANGTTTDERTTGAYVQQASMQVRRLTPVECERLQGFPDGFTLIPVGKKMAADGPRYKALGNSWAVPVVNWIGIRIEQVDEILTNQQPKR